MAGDGVHDISDVSEFFRDNFRKISSTDALKFLQAATPVKSLDADFWAWATIEEAIRPKLNQFTEEEFDTIRGCLVET